MQKRGGKLLVCVAYLWTHIYLYPQGFVAKQENEQLAMLSFVYRCSLNIYVRTNPGPTLLEARLLQ